MPRTHPVLKGDQYVVGVRESTLIDTHRRHTRIREAALPRSVSLCDDFQNMWNAHFRTHRHLHATRQQLLRAPPPAAMLPLRTLGVGMCAWEWMLVRHRLPSVVSRAAATVQLPAACGGAACSSARVHMHTSCMVGASASTAAGGDDDDVGANLDVWGHWQRWEQSPPVQRGTKLDTSHQNIQVAAAAHAHLRKGSRRKPDQPMLVFTSGVPGAGKTFALHRMYGRGVCVCVSRVCRPIRWRRHAGHNNRSPQLTRRVLRR